MMGTISQEPGIRQGVGDALFDVEGTTPPLLARIPGYASTETIVRVTKSPVTSQLERDDRLEGTRHPEHEFID
ncbi:MAG: hypothetical protein KF693_02105 [Nitrospira sp.]|nr:hypothetical protein [Nitrospira sp.]